MSVSFNALLVARFSHTLLGLNALFRQTPLCFNAFFRDTPLRFLVWVFLLITGFCGKLYGVA
jgi:hypothetical protein